MNRPLLSPLRFLLRLRHPLLATGACLALLLALVAPVSAQDDGDGNGADDGSGTDVDTVPGTVERIRTPDPDKIDEAIRRGVEELYDRFDSRLMWESVPYDQREMSARNPELPVGAGIRGGQWGGQTALAVYSLLAAGENPETPKLKEAIAWLTEANIIGTYALGMRAQVWLHLPPRPEYRAAMQRDWRLLGEAIQGNDRQARQQRNLRNDSNTGLFDYLPIETQRIDMSASQYGVLGLWATAEYGAEVPLDYWNAMEQAWLRFQQGDGGWAYTGQPRLEGSQLRPTSLSMTTAGVASLFITQDFLHAAEGVRCNGNITNPAIERGMQFVIDGYPYLLGKKDLPEGNRLAEEQASRRNIYYTLYGIERIGVASGLKYFGDLDWYAEGAHYLLRRQSSTGSWGSTPNTCFALLFLSRGRQPVYMNKLAYSIEVNGRRQIGTWNQRPRDVANLARYIENADERDLNWQTINFGAMDSAEEATRELHDAPVTFLAGSRPLGFNEAEKQALKDYMLTGGLLFANADCGNRRFAESFVKLGEELFAEEGYTFRVLEDRHPIHTEQKFNLSNMRRKPKLLGLSNGVRELMVLVQSDDFGRDWQLFNRQAEEAFQVGTNVYLYAVDNQPQAYKGSTHLVEKNSAIATQKTVKVARIRYDGNWDPEPAGWQRLSAIFHNDRKTDLQVEPVDLAEADLADFNVAHLTGTDEMDLPDEQLEKLRQFVENGGTLIVEAAGGSSAFSTAAERMLQEAFGDAASELTTVLPTEHPIYAAGGGEPLRTIDYRLSARRTIGSERTPRLRGIAFENRIGVILSNEDLSNGLVGSPIGGIVGYSPTDATRLIEAVVEYATK